MFCRSGGGVRSNTDFQILSGFGGTSAGALSPEPGRGRAAPGALNGDENGFLRPRAGLPSPIRLGVAGDPSDPSFAFIGVATGESKVLVVGRSGARDGVLRAGVRGSSSSNARARARFAGLGWGALRPVPSRNPGVGGGFGDPGAGSSKSALAAARLAADGWGADRPEPNVNPDGGDGRVGDETVCGDEEAGWSSKALAAARRSALGRGALPPVPNENPEVGVSGGGGGRLVDPWAIVSSREVDELELGAGGNPFSTSSAFFSRSSSVFLLFASCSSTSRSASRINFCARWRAAALGPFRRLPPAVPNDTVAGITAGMGVGERKSSNGSSDGGCGCEDGGGSAGVSYSSSTATHNRD